MKTNIRNKYYPTDMKTFLFSGINRWHKFKRFLNRKSYASVFVLCDTQTYSCCYPLLKKKIGPHRLIKIPAGEAHKNLISAGTIWSELTRNRAGRDSVLINLGGGMVSDLGGFAASVYKRGIDFVNIPTTLLAQCDAAFGGKTAVDFTGIKNQLGSFHFPAAVLIEPQFLKSQDPRNLLSGFAEIIKSAVIADKRLFVKIARLKSLPASLHPFVYRTIKIKQSFVIKDPYDRKERNALNFGHTIGHAVESLWFEKKNPLLHGEAIALGMVAESFIAHSRNMLSLTELNLIADVIQNLYRLPEIPESDFDAILKLVQHDKKNRGTVVRMSLPEGIGRVKVNRPVKPESIFSAMHFCNLALHN